ncbi:MAG: peptidase domain-containing ABC transporter, partial [Gammaproteobacteria bacterium]|nr:peptidase domain-containing ABC transporter [Gammaproteobacteria bacterium]
MPVLLQNESCECALACLAMIAGYHGHRTDLGTLRRQFRVPLTGSSVKSIVRIATGLNISARAVRLEPEELKQLTCPAILHWRLNHFVVLAAIRFRGIIVHDPARGRRFISWKDVSRFFTGVAAELTPTRHFEQKDDVNR